MQNPTDELTRTQTLLHQERQWEYQEYLTEQQQMAWRIRRHRGSVWYPVQLKEQNMGLGQRLVVILERTAAQDKPHQFRSGTPVNLLLIQDKSEPQAPCTGVIQWVRDNQMQVMLHGDEPPDDSEYPLVVELFYEETSFRAMEQALGKVLQAKSDRLAQLRDILLGAAEPDWESQSQGQVEPGLNEAQNQALYLVARARDVALIHGPPGTGKTTTLIHSIIVTLRQEPQVLVCAPSNTAVDLLTEQLAQRGISVVRLGHPARVSPSTLAFTLDEQVLQHSETKRLKQLRKEAIQTRQQALKYKRHFGAAERRERREQLQEARALQQDIRHLEKRLVADVLDKAQVIACTLVGANQDVIKERQFQTVFIDEAAQALEPACWIPILKAGRVIMAGDHCQLPPTVKDPVAEREGLSQTLFEKVAHRHPEAVALLTCQYRMHPLIMGFSNQLFYKQELVADVSVQDQLLGCLPPCDTPVTLIDTAGCGFEEEQESDSTSFANSGEADLLWRYLSELVAALPEAARASLGIITPYRGQVTLLQNQWRQHKTPDWPTVSIDSVDGFQGQERDIIAISLVRSNDKGDIGFLADTRRMNVAMTRARRKLILIGDSATLAIHPFYRDLLMYVEAVGDLRSGWEWM